MSRPVVFLLILLSAAVHSPHCVAEEPNRPMRVYFGTYTERDSQGIYVSTFDAKTGELSPPQLAAACPQPSFLTFHLARPLLYAANETLEHDGKPGGFVTAYAINTSDGHLSELNRQATHGAAPCHLIVGPSGRHVLVANYLGGNLAVLPIKADGSLARASCVVQHEGSSVNPRRQEGPHAHSVNLDASGEIAVVCDLGLDRVLMYKYDAEEGMLTPHDPPFTAVPPGGGPRHFAFHPSGRFGYANLEMASQVQCFRYQASNGVLSGFQTIDTIPDGFPAPNSTAEIQVHPSGRFVYCSNRGHDSIAVFRVNDDSGELALVENEPTHGQIPRNFGIDPTGTFLLAANQQTDNVVVFRIDPETGSLSPTGRSQRVPMPVCVKFAPGD